jgi:hypothetical protein
LNQNIRTKKGKQNSTMDYSTLNTDALTRLKTYTLPDTYRLQEHTGNGCAGDPPGYPTYFTRSVYTRHGNEPDRSATQVISLNGTHYATRDARQWDEAKDTALMRSLWKPLPLDHPRTRLWIENTYRHQHHCYADAARPEYGRPGTLIYPVPGYNLKTFRDDPRWSDAYRATAQAEVEEYNRMELERAAAIAIPANHKAVLIIQVFYPEYRPEPELIANPPAAITQWWETEATPPAPEECTPRSCGPHPVNGTWCQWCGWSAAKLTEAGQ